VVHLGPVSMHNGCCPVSDVAKQNNSLPCRWRDVTTSATESVIASGASCSFSLTSRSARLKSAVNEKLVMIVSGNQNMAIKIDDPVD
jgi:hypothetical protein